MKNFVLVSCVGQKASVPQPAKDLYQSPWFKLARQYAEKVGDYWYILSAEYGLIHPNRKLVPYNETLNTMPIIKRQEWANMVFDQIYGALFGLDILPGQEIIILAGQRYREFLVPRLIEAGYQVSVPMKGLGIGQQMSWMKSTLKEE